MKQPILAAAIALGVAGPGLAQGIAIPQGGELDAVRLAHIFVSGCDASQPLRLESAAEIFALAFWFTPTDAGDADIAYASNDWGLRAEVESGALEGSCTLIIPAEGYPAADELGAALEARISDMARDSEVSADSDGWHWSRSDVAHTVSLIQIEGAILMRHSAER